MLTDMGHDPSSSLDTSTSLVTTPIIDTYLSPSSKDHSDHKRSPSKSAERNEDSALKERDVEISSLKNRIRYLEVSM